MIAQNCDVRVGGGWKRAVCRTVDVRHPWPSSLITDVSSLDASLSLTVRVCEAAGIIGDGKRETSVQIQ